MFTETDRDELLQQLVEHARADPEIESAALVGSAARGTVDRWSDIDLTLGLTRGIDAIDAADRWTHLITELAAVSDTLDIWAGPALCRVFLLDTSLQVDVSFWPADTLAATGGQSLALLFGKTAAPTPALEFDLNRAAAWGWLYALHTRSAIARGRNWQAAQMLEGLRGQVITLSCSRHGLETDHGRGVDQLPESVLTALAATYPSTVTGPALAAAYTAAVRLLDTEIGHVDPVLASRLKPSLTVLGATTLPLPRPASGQSTLTPPERP